MPWLTADDLTARLPDFDPADTAQVSAIESLIAEAEAYIQAETGETIAAPATADRVVYGSGTAHLAVDIHDGTIAATDIAIASGAAVPSLVDRGRYLTLVDADGDLAPFAVWPEGQKITITADWGEAVPADLLTACRDLVVAWYVASLTDDATQTTPDIPPIAARIIARRRASAAVRRMFA